MLGPVLSWSGGYTIVANGWDFGASGFDAMKMIVPIATHDGETVTGPSYEYIVFDNNTTLTSELAYAAATADKSQAQIHWLAMYTILLAIPSPSPPAL
jgi:hypothetical protein